MYYMVNTAQAGGVAAAASSREADSRFHHRGVLQAWVMDSQSVANLVCSVCARRGGADALEICCSHCIAVDGDLVVEVGARVADKQGAGRHD